MKKIFTCSLGVLFLGLTVYSCTKDKPVTSESNKVLTTAKGALYTIDTLNSKVNWKGYKILKSDHTSHIGSIKFESGKLTVLNKQLESGEFVVSMKTIKNDDLQKKPDLQKKLVDHLSGKDFFEIDKFPTASFAITKVTPLTTGDYNTQIDGNLTIKGITKPQTFMANVRIKDGNITIATQPTDINRQDFGVKFQVPAQDGVLNDEITLQILLKAMESK